VLNKKVVFENAKCNLLMEILKSGTKALWKKGDMKSKIDVVRVMVMCIEIRRKDGDNMEVTK
jgi:nitroimidazol reductase NimA-like FMN-containing flavoprotein (pyridoxamine 5'-phosphate oxidase superfamily)